MPNDNLGTAHGRIRVTYEEKGSKKATEAMQKMQRQMAEMQKRLDTFEKSLNESDKALRKEADSLEKSQRSARKYQSEVEKSGRNSNKFRKEVEELVKELEDLAKALENAEGSNNSLNRSMQNSNRRGGAAYSGQIQSMRLMAAAFKRLEGHFEKMDKSLDKVNANLSENSLTLKDAARSMKAAENASRGFSISLFDASKSVRAFRRDLRYSVEDLRELYGLLQQGGSHYRNFSTAIRIFNTAGRYGRNENLATLRALSIGMAEFSENSSKMARTFADVQRTFLSWFTVQDRLMGTRSLITLFGSGITVLRNRLYGVGEAIDRAPRWVGQLSRLAGAFTMVSAAGFGIAKVLGPFRLIQRIAQSGVIEILARSSDMAAAALWRLGDQTVRTFGRRAIPAMEAFRKAAVALTDPQIELEKRFRASSIASQRFSTRLFQGATGLKEWANTSKSLLTGIALLTSSLGSLWHRFQWFFKLPKPIMAGLALFVSRVLPTALAKLGNAFNATSNFILGFWDGLKQLGRGFASLPGLIAGVAASITSLIPLFAGLGDNFKDLFDEDPIKRLEAFMKLPAHLRPFGSALLQTRDKFEKMQEAVQKVGFKGVEKDFKVLTDVYFPLFEKASIRVVTSFRNLKDELVEFSELGQTQTDFSSVYENTAGAINAITEAVKPALAGLTDMSVVGMQFFRDMSGWASILSVRFAEWARVNRENGNMMHWMVEGKQGVKDLVKGMGDLSKGVLDVLTLFSTKSGDDALQRFAASMERFKESIEISKFSGSLARIRNTINTMGADKMDDLRKLMRTFGDAVERTTPFLKQLSDSFSTLFVPAMEKSIWVISQFLKVVNELGLDKLIGWILGIAGAATLLPKVFSTTVDALKAVAGAIMVLWNRKKVISGLETAFVALGTKIEGMGKIGGKVGNGMLNVTSSFGRLAGIVGSLVSGFASAAAAGAVLFALYSSNKQAVNDFNKQLESNKAGVLDFRDALNKAFLQDRGQMGSSVMASISSALDDMYQNMKDTADDVPGWGQHVWDYTVKLADSIAGIVSAGNWNIGDFEDPTKAFSFGQDQRITNQMQEQGTAARRAMEKLKELREEGVDLTRVMALSDPEFKKWIDHLRKAENGGEDAAKWLEEYRKEVESTRRSYEELGPAGVDLVNGLKAIADAGDDAGKKLDGLRLVLQGLGLLRTTAVQAAAEYADAIDNLGKKARDALVEGESFSEAWDDVNKTFRVMDSGTARNLVDVLARVGLHFQTAAANAEDLGAVDEMFERLDGKLGELATTTGIAKEELLEYLRTNEGVAPEPIKLALQFGDLEGSERAFGEFMLQLQYNANKTPIKVPLDTKNAANEFKDNLNKQIGREIAEVVDKNVVIKPGVEFSQDELDKLKATLDKTLSKQEVQPEPTGKLTPEVETVKDDFEKWLEAADLTDEAKQAGKEFVDSYAQGIKNNNAANRAVENMMEEILKRGHRSPPQKGPLSKRGDMVKYQGRKFAEAYATGIHSGEPTAANAASALMGGAGAALGGGEKIYQAGQFLGQVTQLLSFVENAVNAFSMIGDAMFGFARFMSDPMGRGTFFGQSSRWRRDSKVSDDELARRQADAAQQRRFSFYGSGQRNLDWYDRQYGMARLDIAPGQLSRDASREELSAAIVAEGQRRGLTQEQITSALATAIHESGLSATAVGKGHGAFLPGGGKGDAYGVFQQTPEGGWGTPEQLTDPNYAINKFFDAYEQTLKSHSDPLVAATLTQNPQLGSDPQGSAYHNIQQQTLAEAMKEFRKVMETGATLPTTTGGLAGIPSIGGVGDPKTLSDTGKPSQPTVKTLAAILEQMFPGQLNLSGSRPTDSVSSVHPEGRALDIGIPNWDTPEGKRLGDEIDAFVRQNREALGVSATIWQDMWRDFKGNESGSKGHLNHVHVEFADGAKVNIGPSGSRLRLPYNSRDFIPESSFGLPVDPDEPPAEVRTYIAKNPETGEWEPATPHGTEEGRPPAPINRATGQPWTPEEAAAFYNDPRSRELFDQGILRPGDDQVPGLFEGTQEDQLREMQRQTPLLQQAISVVESGNASDAEFGRALDILQMEQDRQVALDTPGSRALAQQIGSTVSSAAQERGFAQANPIDDASEVVGIATSLASDIFAVLNSGVAAIDGTKNLADMLVRGPSNTEDIYNAIDEIQKYIQFAADIAGAVSSVTGALGAGSGADPSGASSIIAGVAQIAALVQGALETVNAVIDLGQEAYRIIGTYVGDFLGYLVGGLAGPLQGNIKFLLDDISGQLLAYSADNPLDKRAHKMADRIATPEARNQVIGELNYYAGPGQDPRDATRQMMFQVRTAQLMTATGN